MERFATPIKKARSFERTEQCRGWDLDPRPRAYESPALPLSYLGRRRRCYYGVTFLSTLRFRFRVYGLEEHRSQNGTERVVVSQLIRSPGVYFEAPTDRATARSLAAIIGAG